MSTGAIGKNYGRPSGVYVVVVAAGPVHVAVLEFFLRGLAHFGDLDLEVEVLAGQRMVAVDGDHVALDAGDGHDHARCPSDVWAWNCMPGFRFATLPNERFGTRWISYASRSP